MTERIKKIDYYIDLLVQLQEKRIRNMKNCSYKDAINNYVSQAFIGMFFEDINFLVSNEEKALIHQKVQLKLLSNMNDNIVSLER